MKMQPSPPMPCRRLAPVGERLRREVALLLESTERVLGLRCVFHDLLGLSGLPHDRRMHVAPPCRAVRVLAAHNEACIRYDWVDMHRRMPGQPAGEWHDCPFGFTKIVVPVCVLGQYGGALFAGPCWRHAGRLPHRDLPRMRDTAQIEDAWRVLQAVAARLGVLLEGEPHLVLTGRRDAIHAFLRDHLDADIGVRDLARTLSLSPSRTAHLVRETFGCGFTALVRHLRMRQAAEWLATTDRPVSEIARFCGIADQNYFTRLFRKEFACSPREYRNGAPFGSPPT